MERNNNIYEVLIPVRVEFTDEQMANIEEALEETGASMDDFLKILGDMTSLNLAPFGDFDLDEDDIDVAIDQLYEEFSE